MTKAWICLPGFQVAFPIKGIKMRTEKRWAGIVLAAVLLLPVLPLNGLPDGIRFSGESWLNLAWFSLLMALTCHAYCFARPAAVAGAAFTAGATYLLYYRAIVWETAGGSGGASFMGLLWLFFWFGCLLAAVFSAVAVISQAKAYRQSTTVAALAAALTNGLGFALPWLIFYVM